MITETFSRVRLLAKSLVNRRFDALDRLQVEHLRVRALFFQIRATSNPRRRHQLFERVRREIELHAHIEEAVFYPACEKIEQLRPLVLEAIEEHKQVKSLLRQIGELARDSERWEPKARLLMDNFEHHVRQEELLIFPRVRRYFDYLELEQLGGELVAAKKKGKTAMAA